MEGRLDAYDLATLFAHRAVLEDLDPDGPPRLVALRGAPALGSLAVFPGSFNPPTSAHLLLAERARREGFACVLFVLARNTVGKEPSGMIAEDRLLALRFIAQRAGMGVAVCSSGLYVDMADAAAMLYPGTEVAFLIGSDKVSQIFDASFYTDRENALDALFARARLVVAPRTEDGGIVEETMERAENRRFADRVSVLPLHPAVSDLSSTRVRGLLQSGAEPTGLVPSAVGTFLGEVGAFAPAASAGGEEIDRYRLRSQLLDALWDAKEWAVRAADFRSLLHLATQPGDVGKRMRGMLSNGGVRAEELAEMQSSSH
ncbi:MAG: nicotinate-nicotinamide nucleotide adenylyltransferase [Actinomycetota bacterium]